jgi:hypothetical protein
MGQKYAVYDETGRVTAFYDADLCSPPEGSSHVAITDDEHMMLLDGASNAKRAMIDENGKPALVPIPDGS